MIEIDENINIAQTLPGSFYKDKETFEQITKNVFSKSWQFIDDATVVSEKNSFHPFVLMDGVLNEQLLLSSNDGSPICISNVCTHRGQGNRYRSHDI